MEKWKIILSPECDYKNEEESRGCQCEHPRSDTKWRSLGGICDVDFCPIRYEEVTNE